jgi:hypothetical protein
MHEMRRNGKDFLKVSFVTLQQQQQHPIFCGLTTSRQLSVPLLTDNGKVLAPNAAV